MPRRQRQQKQDGQPTSPTTTREEREQATETLEDNEINEEESPEATSSRSRSTKGLKGFLKHAKNQQYRVVETRVALVCSFGIFFKLIYSESLEELDKALFTTHAAITYVGCKYMYLYQKFKIEAECVLVYLICLKFIM